MPDLTGLLAMLARNVEAETFFAAHEDGSERHQQAIKTVLLSREQVIDARRNAAQIERQRSLAAGGMNDVQRSVTKLEAFTASNTDHIAKWRQSGYLIDRHSLSEVEATHYVRHLFDGLYIRTAAKTRNSVEFQDWLDSIPDQCCT